MAETPPQDLLHAAREAQAKAYVPYSHFPVGAALRLADGRIVQGCNVENASYGLSMCAERNASFAAVTSGATSFREVLVVGETAGPIAPCGACRQVLLEFTDPAAPVWLVGRDGTLRTSLAELLPHAFSPRDLDSGE